jgi:hypothetical protein
MHNIYTANGKDTWWEEHPITPLHPSHMTVVDVGVGWWIADGGEGKKKIEGKANCPSMYVLSSKPIYSISTYES